MKQLRRPIKITLILVAGLVALALVNKK